LEEGGIIEAAEKKGKLRSDLTTFLKRNRYKGREREKLKTGKSLIRTLHEKRELTSSSYGGRLSERKTKPS